MRECPKCGFIDPPYWRHVRHRLYTNYCHIGDLRIHNPKLAFMCEYSTEDFVLANYIFHYMPKTGIVQRIHVSDSRDGKTIREPEQEKHFKFVPINQSRLLEDCQK